MRKIICENFKARGFNENAYDIFAHAIPAALAETILLEGLNEYEDDGPNIDMEEQNANKDRIIKVLRSFGIEISSIKASVGPTITLYEITPAEGVRISKIRNLEDDIALSLSALGIRIIAPIPGKGTIGIEVPNANPRIVPMKSILNSKKFQETTYELPVGIR